MTQVPPPQPLPAPRQAEGMNRFTVGRWFAAGGGALVLILLVGIALSVNALNQLGTTRDQVVEVIDPALMRSLELTSALTGQDTAIRAYGLTGERGRFDEYQAAVAAERRAAADLTRHLRELPGGDRLAGHVGRITAAAREWREEYAERVAEQVREKGEYPISRSGGTRGVELFTGVRASLAPLQGSWSGCIARAWRACRAGPGRSTSRWARSR
ncbi:CHASE3 domain-containing protein [Thermocatellispora tengchongensis]|uniref:CHASE3 domain-containing protein n=1 Tax=Thermocatellispora tengchongensis TaxID=1073253 RepID=UPI0036381737